ncbi:MAG: PIN domain-containing protein [Verrucomicrobiaceae bacterium]|jgi:predicted nucleic acid-binding protein|nr:MAG: PIN domain-containing protein [Verrucomicrobiaceae bacterium]
MRIFLDANILFSAGKSSGAVRAFLVQLKSSGHVLVADGYVVGEARRNLEAKFPTALKELEDLMKQVEASARTCGPLRPEIAPNLPAKDRPVLAASIHHQCQVLLTGDKTHFGPLYGRTIETVEIHSPASLAIKVGIFGS